MKNTESLWYLVDSKSYSDTNMGKVFGGDQTYYFDLKTKQYLEQRNFLDNYFLIQSPQKDFHWELIDESKQILGYTCKKAISKEIKTINGINKTFVTEAWYCPTLKYSIGPLNFGGLDGLILEMTNQKRKYYCTEILSDDKMEMFIIAKPKQGKVVTEEEFLIETKNTRGKGNAFF
ncbi:GLPGLI family protein [Flavobacterium sp. SUN052]|uniref:GLPGLI family protein n=1 Tax=Flavobacterium sp. SUN052 TaxID=3002441 RepID=UPI00237EAF3B|nr:GLPGLI family protein [Flavobacterium sp. SUN052]MEC4003386.1 GLPGLI family protein [Flavobacterium sp. SUN052]